MVKLSSARAGVCLLPGLDILSRGKVRDTYRLPNGNLLSLATEGISIFDFTLNALVPLKGIILNATSHFWANLLSGYGTRTHLVAAGAAIDPYLPEYLRGHSDLQSRATVIKELDMVPVEFIARSVLTGSALKSYRESGEVCGHRLPPGLQDGDELPFIMDSPTTKAEEGHDENVSAEEARAMYPSQTFSLFKVFEIGSWWAKKKGIKYADTKLEFGKDGTLGDEILTPDSSRCWEYKTWEEGRKLDTRKAPPPYDKQFVRAWGIEKGVNRLDPKNPGEVDFVHGLAVPSEIIFQTTRIYRYIFWRLTGKSIEAYLSEDMGIAIRPRAKDITIVCGSESDLPEVGPVVSAVPHHKAKITVHVMSCHRNPYEVERFAKDGCRKADAIICVGSKAFQLPGVLGAFSHANGINTPVIGVILGKPGSKARLAAQLSIEELPDQPVIMNEITGECYSGSGGLGEAINRVIGGELPLLPPRKEKCAIIGVIHN